MKILLTNDDGWDAPGLAALKSVAETFGDVWVVAPLQPMSGISHQMTFERPLTLQETGAQAYSLDGTPADCVRIATTQLSDSFDWVLSGINNGGNLGSDIYVSGTVAAAREASIRGYRSMALSQHRHRFKESFDWTRTTWMCERLFQIMLNSARTLRTDSILNVNFPDKFHPPKRQAASQNGGGEPCPVKIDRESFQREIQLVDCPVDRHPVSADFQIDSQGRFLYCGKYNQRPQTPGSDISICFGGQIAVSLLRW
jgi:5'-nucleotidase